MWADMRTRARMKNLPRLILTIPAFVLMCGGIMKHSAGAAESSKPKPTAQTRDWPIYGGQKAGDHYSPLKQINRSNIARLRVAWSFDTREKGVGLQTSPLIVGRTLYAYTPTPKVI